MTRTVTIVQRRLTGYRVPLFEKLRSRLASDRVRLRLIHGVGTPSESLKKDDGHLDWAESLPTRYLWKDRLCWQPIADKVSGEDLIVLTQENALLANHLALWRRPARRVAFWGHGANLQGDSRSLRELYKNWSTRQVDWYFAYTRMSVDLVVRSGFPRDRITQLDNAIDVSAMQADIASVSDEDLANMRSQLGIGAGPIGLFIGSLYAQKRLDILISAAQSIRSRIPSFQLVIVGAGPDVAIVEAATREHGWIRYGGKQSGRAKATLLRMATIVMNPGLVGLGIMDSFSAQVPMVTTACGLHSPEIAYLDESNGVMTRSDLESFVSACLDLLEDGDRRAALAQGCRQAAERYTLPNMVENFATGICNALDVPR